MKQKTIQRAGASLLCGAVFTTPPGLGGFYSPGQMLSDSP